MASKGFWLHPLGTTPLDGTELVMVDQAAQTVLIPSSAFLFTPTVVAPIAYDSGTQTFSLEDGSADKDILMWNQIAGEWQNRGFVEEAQDAVGSAFDSTLVYTDGSNSMGRAAISGDITIAAGSNSADITAGSIVNADISGSAAIALSKLATQAANTVLVNATAGVAVPTALDIAANSILGRITGGVINDTPIGFGLSFDTTSLRINLAETKFDWLGDHTFRDNMFRLLDSSATETYFFRTSNLAASRDVTLPLLTGNDTFLFEAHTQGMSNKTITSSSVNSTPIGASSASTGVFTQVDSDNLRLDGNTLSSTDTNGNILIDPNGTGSVRLGASATDYWNFDSAGTMSPVNPNNVAPFRMGVDMWAFNVNGTLAGLFFRFAGTVLAGIPGYVFPDLAGADIASIDVATNESIFNTVYGLGIGQSTPAALTANTDNWALLANNAGTVYRVSASSAVNLTGIVAPATAARTRLIILDNVGANAITLKHLVTSTAANQFRLAGAADRILQPQGTAGSRCILWYDTADTKWHDLA